MFLYSYGRLFGCSRKTTLTETGLLVVSFWKGLSIRSYRRALMSSLPGEIDLMESRGNGPSYPAQYGQHVSLDISFPFLF